MLTPGVLTTTYTNSAVNRTRMILILQHGMQLDRARKVDRGSSGLPVLPIAPRSVVAVAVFLYQHHEPTKRMILPVIHGGYRASLRVQAH